MHFARRSDAAENLKRHTTSDWTRRKGGGSITLLACVLGFVSSMGGFQGGYAGGQVSGFFNMFDFVETFHDEEMPNGFSPTRQGTMIGMFAIGCLFGALIAGKIADTLGRRRAISVSAYFCCVGVAVETASAQWWHYAIGRFLTGLAVGSLSVVIPMYQGESSPPMIRGFLCASYQLFVTLGILGADLVNLQTARLQSSASWRIPCALTCLWALLVGSGVLFLPESPRYAYRQGREDEARRTIAKLSGVDPNASLVEDQIAQIRVKQENESEDGGSLVSAQKMFTGRRMAHRTLLGMALQAGRQLSGVNFFIYYGTTAFLATGIEDPHLTQVILGAVNAACTIPGLYVAQRCGRRNALICGALWMMMCFVAYSFIGQYLLNHEQPPSTPMVGSVLIVFSCLFIAAYSTTWGPLTWVVVAELYPAKYRAPCMALALASNWSWHFVILFATRFIADSMDYLYGFVFAVALLALAGIVYFFLMESHGKTLEEIDTMYVLGVNPRSSTDWDERELHRLTISPRSSMDTDRATIRTARL